MQKLNQPYTFTINTMFEPTDKQKQNLQNLKDTFRLKAIETKEDAIKVIKDASNGFLILAAIQIVLGLLVMPQAIVDGVVFLILALLLRKLNSRVVAFLLLLLSLGTLVVTIINSANGTGGSNIFLAVVMVIISIRAIQATLTYNKLTK